MNVYKPLPALLALMSLLALSQAQPDPQGALWLLAGGICAFAAFLQLVPRLEDSAAMASIYA